MIYTKFEPYSGEKQHIALAELPIYSMCPICRREFPLPEFWTMISDPESDFDENSDVYCDECTAESLKLRKSLSTCVPESRLDNAVHHAMKSLNRGLIA